MEDIDARLDELTSAIHEAMFVAAPNKQPVKQLQPYIPPRILTKIRENRLGIFYNTSISLDDYNAIHRINPMF